MFDLVTNVWGGIPLNLSGTSHKRLARFQSNVEFMNTFQSLYNTAMNTFKWTVPETCDERMIERSLLLTGRVLFVEENDALLSLAGGGAGSVNIYGYPLTAYGWGLNGFNKEYRLYLDGADISKDVARGTVGAPISERQYNAVLGYDNANAYPYINYILAAAERLSNTQRALDVAVQNLKQPVIITCEETQVKAAQEALNNRDSNVAAIISSGKLPIDSFKVWDTHANPQTLVELRNYYEWIENQVKEVLGIEANAQTDKKERLLVDEVNANNQSTEISTEKRLAYRKRLADLTNKAFPGYNISVELRNPPQNEMEVEENDPAGTGKASGNPQE